MGTIVSEPKVIEQSLINAAKIRVADFPAHWHKIYYSQEVNSLFVQILPEPVALSRHDFDNDVIYNLNKHNTIVSFEILGLL